MSNNAPVINDDLDTVLLEQRVKAMYKAVAADPHGDFHFEMGRVMAERLGYPASQMEQVPAPDSAAPWDSKAIRETLSLSARRDSVSSTATIRRSHN